MGGISGTGSLTPKAARNQEREGGVARILMSPSGLFPQHLTSFCYLLPPEGHDTAFRQNKMKVNLLSHGPLRGIPNCLPLNLMQYNIILLHRKIQNFYLLKNIILPSSIHLFTLFRITLLQFSLGKLTSSSFRPST